MLPPGAPMSEVIQERFDLLDALHVIEHTVSMIDFLNDCTKLLVLHGTLALVVPDDRTASTASASAPRSPASSTPVNRRHPPSTRWGTVIEERLNAVKHRIRPRECPATRAILRP